MLVEQDDGGRSRRRDSARRTRLPTLCRQINAVAPRLSPPDLSDCINAQKAITTDRSVWEDADALQSLYLVESGIAFRFTYLANGKRHIDDFYGPGSICNWSRLNSEGYRCNLTFKSGARFTLLDPARMRELLRRNQALASAMNRIETARTLRVSQRIRALISMPASHRIAIFLLDLKEEYRLSGSDDSWTPFSLTQEEIADVTGMTVVHVNRTLAKMEQADELQRNHGAFCLPNPKRLESQLGYRRFIANREDGDA